MQGGSDCNAMSFRQILWRTFALFIFINLCFSSKELVAAYAAEAKATGRPQLMLTAAVSAGKGTIDEGYEIAEIAK